MPLTCSCDWDGYDFEPGEWCFDWFVLGEVDFEPLDSKRRKRCCSCCELIDIGSPVIRYSRSRYPYTDAESRIICGYCDLEEAMENEPAIRMSDLFQCEKCGEIWLNLQSVGFECLSPNEDMKDLLGEYQREYAPPKLLSA